MSRSSCRAVLAGRESKRPTPGRAVSVVLVATGQQNVVGSVAAVQAIALNALQIRRF